MSLFHFVYKMCNAEILDRKRVTRPAGGGPFPIDLFRLPQFSDGGFLLLRGDGGGGHAVNHGFEQIRRQRIQIGEVLLTDIPQERGDLGIIYHTRQGDALPGGKNQRVKPHGDHRLHPGQSADDGAGAAGVIQKIVGDVQTGGSQPPGAGSRCFSTAANTGVRP